MSKPIRTFRDLLVWQKSMVLVTDVYRASSEFPTHERYGHSCRGFGRRNLFQMIRFAEVFPEEEIVHTLSAQLSWSHFVEIMLLDDRLKRKSS